MGPSACAVASPQARPRIKQWMNGCVAVNTLSYMDPCRQLSISHSPTLSQTNHQCIWRKREYIGQWVGVFLLLCCIWHCYYCIVCADPRSTACETLTYIRRRLHPHSTPLVEPDRCQTFGSNPDLVESEPQHTNDVLLTYIWSKSTPFSNIYIYIFQSDLFMKTCRCVVHLSTVSYTTYETWEMISWVYNIVYHTFKS